MTIVRDWFEASSGIPRTSSERNGLHAEQPRSGVEQGSNESRRSLEPVSKNSRSALEHLPDIRRIGSDRNVENN
ncbi:hypothetical protein [Parapedobacter lycopersici]|uniref:hypothetical protein n=1 Tax=Parapedobacter lycopersici TaxID=1864939 RepID=UPI00214D3E55|nr:hypothetical protein [Parapedobacter lycopersici]